MKTSVYLKTLAFALALSVTCVACRKSGTDTSKPVDDTGEYTQLVNGGFEEWEGSGKETEPVQWNSYVSGTGEGIAYTAGRVQQIAPSNDTRPGSEGVSSVCIYTRSVLGVVANGNLTTGQVHMGSTTAADKSNYNFSQINHADYCQRLTAKPDSIRFWAKFTCPDAQQYARMSALVHDAYPVRDPYIQEDLPHIVAKAACEFQTGTGEWKCYTVPFEDVYPELSPKYIILTFTTNKIPGKGSKNDKLYVDDVSLVYNKR